MSDDGLHRIPWLLRAPNKKKNYHNSKEFNQILETEFLKFAQRENLFFKKRENRNNEVIYYQVFRVHAGDQRKRAVADVVLRCNRNKSDRMVVELENEESSRRLILVKNFLPHSR